VDRGLPDSDEHFSQGVQRLTRMEVGEPVHLRLTDDRIFEYPWLYATQTGWWGLSDREIIRLREYLLRGGFLMWTTCGARTRRSGKSSPDHGQGVPGETITDILEWTR